MDIRKAAQPHPTLPVLFWSFAKIGAFTIGGGYAMVPLIRTELVQRQVWLPDEEFAETLSLSQTAPGAIAINTAVFAGYRLRRLAGALVSCLGVVLPSFVIILAIAATLPSSSWPVSSTVSAVFPSSSEPWPACGWRSLPRSPGR